MSEPIKRNCVSNESYSRGVMWLESNRDQVIANRPPRSELAAQVSEAIDLDKVMAEKTLNRMLHQLNLHYRAKHQAKQEGNTSVPVEADEKLDRIITLLEALCVGLGCNMEGGSA